MESISHDNERVTTALLLAAGTGSRLYPLTKSAPKCLTMVNGKSILERMVEGLKSRGFKKLVVVTGYLENHIRDFLGTQRGNLKIEYVFSPLYKDTNNIYSLWMARKAINGSFLLLESDLVFDESLLDKMLIPNRIAVAKMKPWLNGTCVTLNRSQGINGFINGDEDSFGEIKYKTVNIYTIAHSSWKRIVKRLDKHISNNNVNSYYETVFDEMIADDTLSFKAASFDNKPWYEIDTIEDLRIAEKIFPATLQRNSKNIIPAGLDFLNEKLLQGIALPGKTAGVLSATS